MVITQDFINEFQAKAGEADGKAARFEREHFYSLQKTSSLAPLYRKFVEKLNQELDWDGVKAIVARIPVEKQQKYAAAIKFVQKRLQGHGSHMFHTLLQYGVKISKSQQRYMIPMLSADRGVTAEQRGFAGHGLCFNLSMLWLKEQFHQTPASLFPRLDGGGVMGSQSAYAVTKQAATLTQFKVAPQKTAAGFGLAIEEMLGGRSLSFDNCAYFLGQNPDIRGLVVQFFNWQHAIAFFRESASSVLFYDGNAGSYRVPLLGLRAFLGEYNNVCLPLKWPGDYSQPIDQMFQAKFKVSLLEA